MRRSPVSCLVLLSLALAGCLSPRKDDSKFFVLSPLTADGAAPRVTTAASRPLILGVGPVQLPAYLDRQEVVTRVAPNRLDLSPIDRWAQPLDTNFTQVLAQDLSSAVGTQQVTFYPWYRSTHVDYQVRVDVYSFEANSNSTVDMTAHWQIFDGDGKLLTARDSSFNEPIQSGQPGAQAAAMSRIVARLSQEIAATIQSMPMPKTPDHA